jgi:hypothetical protein
LLEDQIEDMKGERVELKREIFRLNQCLVPALRSMEREESRGSAPGARIPMTAGEIVKLRKHTGDEPRRVTPVNWMQARERLEFASDATGARFERAVEAHKDL